MSPVSRARRVRDRNGHFFPSTRARLKVLHRCTVCGRDCWRREVRTIRSNRSPLRGSLAHTVSKRVARLCGPVAYEAQRG